VFLLSKQSIRIYFLCIQNRCRSQIAEAFAQKYAQDHVIIESAGLEASTIHPLTIQVMQEVGMDISERVSKKIDMKKFIASNVIVKLCEQVTERCPIVPFGIHSVEWNVVDPLHGEELSIEEVRKTRDEIEKRVIQLLTHLEVLNAEGVAVYGNH